MKRLPDNLSERKRLNFASPWWVIVPIVLGFALRLLALHSLRQTPYFDFLLWDERLYHDWAVKIANGTFLSETVYEFSPLPAYMMAMVYRVFSPDVLYVRYMNILLGVGTCALFYGIGRRVGGYCVGLLSGLLAAIYEPLVFYSIVPLKTTLGVFFFALTLLFFLCALDRPAWQHLLFLGAASGLLLNVRPNAIVILPVLPLILLWVHRNRHVVGKAFAIVGFFLLGFGIAVSPFTIRNLKVADRFALTTSQAGFNLYLGNHLHSPDPYYRPVPFAVTSPYTQGVQFTIEASRRVGRRLSPEEGSRYWTQAVLDLAAAKPKAFFAKLTRKALVLFNRFEAGDHYDIGFLRKETGFMDFPLPGFGLVFPLGLAGLTLAAFRRSKPAVSLMILFLLYGATLVIFFTNARYRLPLLVILIPYAAAVVVEMAQKARVRSVRYFVVLFVLVSAGTVLELLPIRGTADMTAYYNTHAIVLSANGNTGEAVRYWEASSTKEGGFSDFANLSLAGFSLSRGQTRQAKKWLEKISPGSYAEAQKLVLSGDLALLNRQVVAAVDFYRKALSINAGMLNPRNRLIALFVRFNPVLAGEEKEKKQYIERFYLDAWGKW